MYYVCNKFKTIIRVIVKCKITIIIYNYLWNSALKLCEKSYYLTFKQISHNKTRLVNILKRLTNFSGRLLYIFECNYEISMQNVSREYFTSSY